MISVREVLMPMMAGLKASHGLTLLWSEDRGLSSSALLANGFIALYFDYDIRDRWLSAKLMSASDGDLFTAAETRRDGSALPLYDGAESLAALLHERSGGRSSEAGPLASHEGLHLAISNLFLETERFAPELLNGGQIPQAIAPRPIRFTRRSRR